MVPWGGISLSSSFFSSLLGRLLPSEAYPVELEASFSKPVEFRGAELLKAYPNELTHVTVFRFADSPNGKIEWRLNETFELPVDYVVIELGADQTCTAGQDFWTADSSSAVKTAMKAWRKH